MKPRSLDKKFIDPFLKILPTLDVHGETKDTVTFVVGDFINMHYKMGHLKIAIIHGRTSHILKDEIHHYLKKNDKVSKFYLYNFNDGITIVEIKTLVKLL